MVLIFALSAFSLLRKLPGQKRYRVQQDNYRILYEIVDDELVVTVVKIGHRRHVYRF